MVIKDSGDRTEFLLHKTNRVNRNGDTRGCYAIHGLSSTRIYNIWIDMKKRCYNTKSNRYKRYGGRGITVCDEWLHNPKAFFEWSIENGYADNLTIDRIDNDGNYEPGNCRWITQKEQQRNTSRNRFITANGVRKTMAEWAEITGISTNVIKDRLNKLHWNEQDAVTIPTMKKGEKRYGN